MSSRKLKEIKEIYTQSSLTRSTTAISQNFKLINQKKKKEKWKIETKYFKEERKKEKKFYNNIYFSIILFGQKV